MNQVGTDYSHQVVVRLVNWLKLKINLWCARVRVPDIDLACFEHGRLLTQRRRKYYLVEIWLSKDIKNFLKVGFLAQIS